MDDKMPHGQEVKNAMLDIAHWLISGEQRIISHRSSEYYMAKDELANHEWQAESLVELVNTMRYPVGSKCCSMCRKIKICTEIEAIHMRFCDDCLKEVEEKMQVLTKMSDAVFEDWKKSNA